MMSDSKKEHDKRSSVAGGHPSSSSSSKASENILHSLTTSVRNEIKSYLSSQEVNLLAAADPRLFRRGFYVTQLLSAVAQGKPNDLIDMVRANPQSLFSKGHVTDVCGQIFHDLSPFQLMLFLFDWDMMNQIKPLITEKYREIAYQQGLDMQGGGADLVKIDRDPRTVPFVELTRYIEGHATYSLLENKDGIIFWNDQFFYANQETQTVTFILYVVPADEQRLLDALLISLNEMEMNSARRTSMVEHEFFARTMGYRLERHGIHYQRNGVHYQDVRDGVPLINAYRKYIRIYDARQARTTWDNVKKAWIDVVGLAQRVLPIHILQRFCEENKPFHPLPTVNDLNLTPFRRTLHIHNCVTNRPECLLLPGCDSGVGFSFSVYKGTLAVGRGRRGLGAAVSRPEQDLVAVRQMENVGKANVTEFMRDLEPTHSASSGRRSGSG